LEEKSGEKYLAKLEGLDGGSSLLKEDDQGERNGLPFRARRR
jgi:hypothetical protein